MKITEVPIKAVTMMLRRQTDTFQHLTHISTRQTTPPDPISPSPGIDSDDKVHGGAETEAYGGTGKELS